MIRILIVEDNDYKLGLISSLIKENIQDGSNSIDFATSITIAKQFLMANRYDLMILDLVLPINSDDKNPSPEKGAKFLEEIHYSPTLKPPIHIVGLTEFEDFKDKFAANFTKHVWQLIQYDASSEVWRDTLINIIWHLIKVRKDFLNVGNKVINYDIGIISALHYPELEQFLSLEKNWETFTPEDDFVKYYTSTLSKSNKSFNVIAASADQMGMVASTSLATKMILKFKPRYLIMIGIAAGAKRVTMNFGDILIADQAWDYTNGKLLDVEKDSANTLGFRFQPEPKASPLSAELRAKITSYVRKRELLDRIQNEWQGNEIKSRLEAFVGPVGSGSYVISSAPFVESIKDHQRKLIGIEMEAYGVYYAAEHSSAPKTHAIMIKSVCDFADAEKNDSFQKYAAFTSAKFAYNFMFDEL